MGETVKILIAGTGRLGSVIGLALGTQGETFERIGFDPDRKTSQQARKAGAIDGEAGDLERPAADADLVVLTLGAEQAVEAADALAGALRPDTVVLFTGRLQTSSLKALQERLMPRNPVLGTIPFLGARRALGLEPASEAPTADDYDGGLLGIVLPPGTPEGAVDIALDLATILRTTPFFLDAEEVDSLAATSEDLPAAVAAALLASLAHNPGWRDQRRLVGPSFARLTGAIEGLLPGDVAAAWVSNRVNLLARLDALAAELDTLREILNRGDKDRLAGLLEGALDGHQDWRTVRLEGRPDHGVELPGIPKIGVLDRLIGRKPPPKSG